MMLKLPPSIGRPPAPRQAIERANRAVEQIAERHGAIVVDLTGLRGAELVLPDAVHLTARGEAQVAIAGLPSARAPEGSPSMSRS